MASGDSLDALRGVRNSYYLGEYKKAMEEAVQLRRSSPAPELLPHLDIYSNRALAHLTPEAVFKTIAPAAPTGLQAVKQYATYKTAAADVKEAVVEQLNDWLTSDMTRKDDTLQLMGAHLYFEEGKYKEALKLLRDPGENLEKLALTVQIYLKIDRIDLANKAVQAMGTIDDDDTLTQLATTWCFIAQGGDKLAEASLLLQELIEKFGPSPKVLTTLATCEMQSKNWAGAFAHLGQARALSVAAKTPVLAETLVNSIICCTHLRKPEIQEKVQAELSATYPTHAWLRKAAEMDALFDRVARTYSTKGAAASSSSSSSSSLSA